MKNSRTEAIELIQRLPDGVTTAQIVDALYFKWQVEEGLADVAEGRTLSHDDLKERLTTWRQSGNRSV